MDKKLIIFLLIFFLFFTAYQKFILEPIVKKDAPAKPASSAPSQPAAQNTPRPSPPAVPAPAAEAQAVSETKVRRVVVDTPIYRAEFRNQGAVLTSFRLKKYLDDFGQPLEMIPQSGDGNFPLSLDFEDRTLAGTANSAIYATEEESISLGSSEAADLRFHFSDGIHRLYKNFRFSGNSYVINCTLEASNSSTPIPIRVSWTPGMENVQSYKQKETVQPSRGVINSGSKVERWEAKKVKEFKKVGATIRWAGVENNYFTGIFIPQNQPTDAYMNPVSGANQGIHNVNVLVAGQKPETLQLSLFIGPKDYVVLKQIGMNLEAVLDFGFFGPITKGLFFTLKYFHKFTGNYGWAIVLMTILVKIIFTPFTQMSFASMKKMQQMQPELKKIQEKYGKMKSDDPRKQNMNVEIMQLHKRYGVNPLGGCLPMLLQMPVLFAFYSLLSNVIELRKAPFVLWLQDLSQPDPYYVTPLIMGGTMLLQQKMTPMTDPMQKNMMYIMPVMFTWISFKLQSGLVLYWLLSNFLAIAHQYYFQRQQKVPVLKEKNA